jgi:branched-chain amino acid transport system substrate-binding protein
MKQRRLFSVLAGLLALALVLGACAPAGAPASDTGGEAASEEASTEPIKIGAIFDLTGPTSDIGVDGAEGIQDYVKYLNSKGGIDGRTVELLGQDYGYKVDVAEQLYSQFVDQGAVVFLGWGTGDTEALRGRIGDDEVPFISASYSANLADPAETPYNFLAGTTYSDQLTILLKHAFEEWQAAGKEGLPKVAIFHNDSPFGQSPLPAAEEFQAATGVEFKAIPMPRGATDLTPELTQAKDFGATHIAIQNVSSPAALLLKNKAALGMDDVQVLCLNYCANELLVRLAEGDSEGAIGAIPFTPLSADVPGMADIKEYAEANGIDLSGKISTYAQGWWFAKIMAEGIKRTLDAGQELTGPNIKAALESIDNWDTGGMSAPLTFTAEDHRGQRAVRLYQVQDGVWTQLTDYISAE